MIRKDKTRQGRAIIRRPQSQDYGERQDKGINIFVYFFFSFIYSIVGCIGFSAVAKLMLEEM